MHPTRHLRFCPTAAFRPQALQLGLLAALFSSACSQARSIARTAEQANEYKKQAEQQIAQLIQQSQSESWPQLRSQPELNDSITTHISTGKGVLHVELAFLLAPLAVARFLYMADSNRLIGTVFRHPEGATYLEIGEAKQKNNALQNIESKSHPPEYSEWLRFLRAGTLAMPPPDMEESSALFLVSLSPQPLLWGKFTAFGTLSNPASLELARNLRSEDPITGVQVQSNSAAGEQFLRELKREGVKMLARLRAEVPYQRQGLAAIHQHLGRDFIAVQWPRHQSQPLHQPVAEGSKGHLRRMSDWGLEYKILDDKQASGVPLAERDFEELHLRYAAWATQNDGRSLLLEDTIQEQKSTWARSDQLFPAWQAALLDMRPGERRLYLFPPEGAYGVRGVPPQIPPWSYLVLELQVLGVR